MKFIIIFLISNLKIIKNALETTKDGIKIF